MLFTLRWALYRIKKWHYYLFDFCYVANVLLLVHLWVFPHSAYMHKVRYCTIFCHMHSFDWQLQLVTSLLLYLNSSLLLHCFIQCHALTELIYITCCGTGHLCICSRAPGLVCGGIQKLPGIPQS